MGILGEILKRLKNHTALTFGKQVNQISEQKRRSTNFELPLPISKAFTILAQFCLKNVKSLIE